METEKVDRRVRKTRRQLREGLARLLEEKSIRDIKVKELVEEVDINRSTFYLHYSDIYDMLKQLEEELSPEVESKDEVQIEKPNKKEKSEYEEALLLKYPEFKALIEARGSENISEAELEDLRQKKKIATSYQENSQNITLKQEFTQTVFKTDLLI